VPGHRPIKCAEEEKNAQRQYERWKKKTKESAS